jgi:hypothetical protein
VPDTDTPPGQRPKGIRESVPVIVTRDDQDAGPSGADEFPTPNARLLILVECSDQLSIRLAGNENPTDND